METVDTRTDLVRGILQACYVIEHARAGLQQKWAGDFERDAERTSIRAERLGRLLEERAFRLPDEVIQPHTSWFESLCGSVPTEVPLGAAVLHNFGKWADIFCEPYLTDIEEFRALGKGHTRVPGEPVMLTEEDAFLPDPELPPGRRFVILTDVHIGSSGRDELARGAVDDINSLEPEFVVIPGDITEDGEPDQFVQAKGIFDGLACPWYVVPGNHDAVQRSTRRSIGPKLFRDAFGHDPHDHVIDCGDLQVALVDSTDPTPSPFVDWDIARGSVGGESAGIDSGALYEGQAEALANRLDKSRPVLLVQHHELHPFPGFPPVKFALREEDAQAELDALSGHKLIGVIAGHTHRSALLEVGEVGNTPVPQLEIPSLKDWPFAYSVAGVTNEGVQVVVRQVSDRGGVWEMARRWSVLMRRFALGPLSDLSYTFKL